MSTNQPEFAETKQYTVGAGQMYEHTWGLNDPEHSHFIHSKLRFVSNCWVVAVHDSHERHTTHGDHGTNQLALLSHFHFPMAQHVPGTNGLFGSMRAPGSPLGRVFWVMSAKAWPGQRKVKGFNMAQLILTSPHLSLNFWKDSRPSRLSFLDWREDVCKPTEPHQFFPETLFFRAMTDESCSGCVLYVGNPKDTSLEILQVCWQIQGPQPFFLGLPATYVWICPAWDHSGQRADGFGWLWQRHAGVILDGVGRAYFIKCDWDRLVALLPITDGVPSADRKCAEVS